LQDFLLCKMGYLFPWASLCTEDVNKCDICLGRVVEQFAEGFYPKPASLSIVCPSLACVLWCRNRWVLEDSFGILGTDDPSSSHGIEGMDPAVCPLLRLTEEPYRGWSGP